MLSHCECFDLAPKALEFGRFLRVKPVDGLCVIVTWFWTFFLLLVLNRLVSIVNSFSTQSQLMGVRRNAVLALQRCSMNSDSFAGLDGFLPTLRLIWLLSLYRLQCSVCEFITMSPLLKAISKVSFDYTKEGSRKIYFP